MSIKTAVHPLYSAMVTAWDKCLDCNAGEEAIKKRRELYLHPTAGMHADGWGTANSEGEKAYSAYLQRAVFPTYFESAVEAIVGIIHKKPAVINVPESMKYLLDNATPLGEDMPLLHRKITSHQLVTGRLGLLGDTTPDNKFTILLYTEKSIRNWDDTNADGDSANMRFVVLDESGYELDLTSLEWKEEEKYRIIALTTTQGEGTEKSFAGIDYAGAYSTATLKGDDALTGAQWMQPDFMGKPSEVIPFVFINSIDLAPAPAKPPLKKLADLCVSIFNGDADYRQNLHMQGQDTLAMIGVNQGGQDGDTVRTGAGAYLKLPMGGDAKYIGVSAAGLTEQRTALENLSKSAEQMSAQLINAPGGNAESGDALQIRVAAQTATLPQIAAASAAGLEKMLKILATWMGADPDQVEVIPNLEFSDVKIDGQLLVYLMQARGLGAPISLETIHTWMVENKITSMTLEEELDAIESEPPGLGNNPEGNDNPEGNTPAGNPEGKPENTPEAE